METGLAIRPLTEEELDAVSAGGKTVTNNNVPIIELSIGELVVAGHGNVTLNVVGVEEKSGGSSRSRR